MTTNNILVLYDSFDFQETSLGHQLSKASNVSSVEINSYKHTSLTEYNLVIVVCNTSRDSFPVSFINDLKTHNGNILWIGSNYDKISDLNFHSLNSGITSVNTNNYRVDYNFSDTIYFPSQINSENVILYGSNGVASIPLAISENNRIFVSSLKIFDDFSSGIKNSIFEIPLTYETTLVKTPNKVPQKASQMNIFSENVAWFITLSIIIINLSLILIFFFFRNRYKENLFSKK